MCYRYKFMSIFFLTLVAPISFAENIVVPKVKYNYVSFSSISDKNELKTHTVAAKLSVPINVKRAPVIIIAHGSGGIDERGYKYSKSFNDANIATLEIDMWAARGLDGGLSRPKHVKETLPDIYGAVKYLTSRSDIDTDRIGFIGFSWGGVLAMLIANDTNVLSHNLTALIANYPVCWAYNKIPGYDFKEVKPNKSLLVISGGHDEYDDPQDCANLIDFLPQDSKLRTKHIHFDDATHAFELPRPSSSFFDPYAFKGKGGLVSISCNKKATDVSVTKAVSFMKDKIVNRSVISQRH
ncbi:dienelactone hydrolase family protein [Aliivibrio sp. A6]|uniref:dienelactone hydrolase family protein n=1 Tax=Aliivibrio sp. A6 TaxID=3028427 RepID=UPI0023789776|nr:dienelactone hydrolase family protein [Aliivibrio sp. A6]MDD9180557.1 dienelactone hydrolase family protein [Aliivibrio sp. A6]